MADYGPDLVAQFVLPEVKASGAGCLMQIADHHSARSIAPEATIQKISLHFSCCVPDLQS